MAKMIPYNKMQKKKQRELAAKKRGSWGDINPVTRKTVNPKAYNRKKAGQWRDNQSFYDLPFDNIFNLSDIPLSEELVTVLLDSSDIRIERIVSTGQTSDWYDQNENEFVLLLQGEAEITWADGATTKLSAGDTFIIPEHKRHMVSYTSTEPPCIWLCVFWKV